MKNLPHGDIELEWIGNVLVVYPQKNINLEGAMRFDMLVRESIAKSNFKVFARIFEFRDHECLSVPEAYKHFEKAIRYNLTIGCQYVGIVGANFINERLMGKALESANCPYRFFATKDLALSYMEKNIAGIHL